MLFTLTSMDNVTSADGTIVEQARVIAESKEMTESAGRITLPADHLSVAVQTSNHEWVLSFGYPGGFTVAWLRGRIVLAVTASLAFTILAIAKLQKGESVVEKFDMASLVLCGSLLSLSLARARAHDG
ncbi:hypothetical protein T484DRAFT_1846570 [Baffinella frigidus]|nr:hypothetical protein T484DRAFT_1846570 [Cryptophyta sp. CCMP2293]